MRHVTVCIDMEATGKKLKQVFKERGLTVRKVMELLCLSSHQSVYSWFNGLTLPSIDNFIALSAYLKIPVDDLIVIKDDAMEEMREFWMQQKNT